MNMQAKIAVFRQALIDKGLIDPSANNALDVDALSDEAVGFTQWKNSNPPPWNNWRDFTNFKDWESCGY